MKMQRVWLFSPRLFMLKSSFSCQAEKMKEFFLFRVFFNEAEKWGESKFDQIWAIKKIS
ncbi:hypothetical protein PEDI_45490 [Persicobacter diffluens]|uniref:Uncharacterized protein n=1 Tax=Persicobacter diffluens TaxID=981 RepID=A0AAN4W2N9_9BACT|nr:hypothetical protein PEDI_45490 [Persicobacter diffluens]